MKWRGKALPPKPPNATGREWDVLTAHVVTGESLISISQRLGISAPRARQLAYQTDQKCEYQADPLGRLPPRLYRYLTHSAYDTPDRIKRAADKELLSVGLVGRKGLAEIRAVFPDEGVCPHCNGTGRVV